MALPLVFDFYNSIIEVPAPDTSLTMQYLIDQVRDTEDELTPGLDHSKIADASGKDELGSGVATAITVKLLNQWQIRFEARSGPETVQCTISGGNLVGGPSGNPIAPSAFTQVVNLSSASGTISTPTTSNENVNIKYLLASLGSSQKAIGDVFYWDPVSGSESNTGLTPQTAVATFAKAQSLAATGHHDIIFALSSDPTGITTVTETINIAKNNLKLKGPGYSFQFIPTNNTTDTITIGANNVEVSGFYISTDNEGTADAVSVDGDYCLIKDCWISNVRGHGVNLSGSALSIVTSSVIEHCGGSGTGNGINFGTDASQTVVSKCIIFDNKNGIAFSGTGIADNVVENNLIYKHTGYGVTIGSGVARTTLRSGNTFNKNTLGSTQDLGTDTYIETQAGGESASAIADAVWNEVLADHTGVTGSVAKALKDTKLKATIASLK